MFNFQEDLEFFVREKGDKLINFQKMGNRSSKTIKTSFDKKF